MTSLLKRYTKHIAQLEANGVELVKFNCPDCHEELKTLPAPEGEVWDTFSTCPHCDELFQKITRGRVVEAGRCPRVY